MRQKSHDLQYLETLYGRNGLTKLEENEYWKLLKGYQGEVQFDKFCRYFNEDLTTMDDVTLQLGNSVTQIDKLITGKDILWLADIKNYQGNYRYENHCWTRNESILPNNICEQLSRACRIAQQILYQEGIKLTVQGVLIFINPNAQIKIVDPLNELVLDSNQIAQWLLSLKNSSESTSWQQALYKYRISGYKTSRITHPERFASLKKGICCPNCGSCATKKQFRYTLECHCGHSEAKEKALLRTVCEYGVIRHDIPLKKKNILEFIGEEYSPGYIEALLKKYFVRLKNTYSYENKGVTYDIWFEKQKEYFASMDSRVFWNQK